MPETVIEVESLVKHYPPDIKAVDDISFKIGKGQIFSMLGPNGAGKTTTVEILEGLRNPTSGKARIFGVDILKDYSGIRKRVGILPQNFEPFDLLKVNEAIEYWANLFDKKISKTEVNRLVESVGLTERKSLYAKKLSGGEKRKLGIALSLVSSPELLFLDEPTTGLDPKARRDLWELIKGVKKQGATIFLTTHYLDEAEKLADDVAIMHRGKMIARGSPWELMEKHGKRTTVVLEDGGEKVAKEVRAIGLQARMEDGDVLVTVESHDQMRETLARLCALKSDVKDIYTKRESLEDVFLSLVGSKMEEGVLKE